MALADRVTHSLTSSTQTFLSISLTCWPWLTPVRAPMARSFHHVAPTAWLTGMHTIFGEVANDASKKVVDAISTTQTDPRTDRPVNDVVIESVVVERREG